MNYKRPATYLNKTDRALHKALFYLDQIEHMKRNVYHQRMVEALHEIREEVDGTYREEMYMHEQVWRQNRCHEIVKVWNPQTNTYIKVNKTVGRIINDEIYM